MAKDIIAEKLAELEQRIEKLEGVMKVEKTPLQVVIERSGDQIVARRKFLIKTATEQKEDWEDVTKEFTSQELEEKLHGMES